MPMRAVTGHNWDQSVYDFKFAPQQYGAIYFHDDDLEDAAGKPISRGRCRKARGADSMRRG